MKSKSVIPFSVLTSFLTLGSASSLLGAAMYWDTDKNTAGLQSGDAAWNSDNNATKNRKWNTLADGSGTDMAWVDNADAFFQTSGTSTVTLTSVIFVNSITFNGTGYTIAGPTSGVEVLTLTNTLGTGGIITANADATISARLGGTVGLKKLGTATLTLSGANIYTGLTDVQAGTLALGASNVFADASTLKVSGGILSLVANSDTVAGVQLTAGSITGSGTLTSTTAFDLQAGSISAILGGSVGATKTTAGTVTLSGVNTYTGLTDVQAGTLALGAGNVFADSSTLKVSGGILSLGANNDTVAGVQLTGGSITGSGTLTSTTAFDLQAGSVSAILGGSVGANKTTAGTVTLSGANTYTGTTTISAGTLSAGNIVVSGGNSNLGNASSAVVLGDASNQGTLSYTGAAASYTRGFTINAGGGQLTNAGSGLLTVATGTISAGGLFTVGGASDISISSVVSSNGGLTKAGSDTVTLSGANTYTGATTISAGTLSAGNIVVSGGSSNLGNATSAVVLGDATNQGTLSYTGGAASYTRGFTINAGGGQLTNAGSGPLTVATGTISAGGLFTVGGASGKDISISSGISGTGGLTKTGADTVTLSGTNTYTGITSISDGTLVVNGSTAAGSAVSVASIAKLFGNGTIGGATTILGTQSSGASSGAVGNQTFSSTLAYGNSSIFEWDLNANSTASGFDTVSAGGNITVGTGTVFKVIFGAGVDLANAFWSTPNTTKTWSMASIFGKAFTSGSFASVVSTANPTTQGSFTITGSTLTWTAVPEPTSALAGILLGAGLLRRKRNQRKSA